MKPGRIVDRIRTLFGKLEEMDEARQKNWLLALYVVIILMVNLVSLKLYFRFDLTANSAYSLSSVSREMISKLETPITVRVFFSEDLPAPYNNVPRYLKDLLEEYAGHGRGNFRYRFINPAHEKNKKEIEDYGVRTTEVREFKKDRISKRNAYMAIAIEHEDLLERLDSITGTEGLEYQITSLIKKMTGKVDALHRLKNPINVTLFASKNVPDLGVVVSKVKEQVAKCNKKNYDKLHYNEPVDPYAAKENMARADEFGIQKILLRDQKGKTEEIRLGLVVEHNARFETVHLISRNMFSLYSIIDSLDDIINSIVGSMIGVNPVIGYITGHNELSYADARQGAVNFRPLIPDMYDFKDIDLVREDIPGTIQTLVINGPSMAFGEDELFKIDQFLMKGNSLVVFQDTFREDRSAPRNPFNQSAPMVPNTTGLERLLAHYGVSLGQEVVLDAKCLYYRGESLHVVPQIGADGLSRDNEITRYLKQIYFVKSSPVITNDPLLEKSGIQKTVLVKSSPDSWGTRDFMPWSMYPPEESKRKSYNLAVVLSGRFDSYFRGKEIPWAEGAAVPAKAGEGREGGKVADVSFLGQSLRPGKLLLVGSSEMTKFDYQAQGSGADRPNAVFIQNIVDYMNGNYGIPEMRSKGLELNPIRDDNALAMLMKNVFSMPMADAVDWAKILFKLLNILIMPALIISATGIFVVTRRRAKKSRIAKEFNNREEKAK